MFRIRVIAVIVFPGVVICSELLAVELGFTASDLSSTTQPLPELCI